MLLLYRVVLTVCLPDTAVHRAKPEHNAVQCTVYSIQSKHTVQRYTMYNVNSVYLSIGVVHHPSILSGQVGAHGCVGNVQQDHLLLK